MRPQVLTPAFTRQAEKALCEMCPALAAVIAEEGRCEIPHRRPDLFDTLASSIVSQQLSTKAARTIRGRVADLCGGPRLRADALVDQPDVALREAGLSGSKTRYMKALATATHSGELDLAALRALDDEAVITSLVELPGIGRWTAEMFLMFALKRPDVFSAGDLGLRKALMSLFNKRKLPEGPQLQKLTRHWRPYRTVACWYLWRTVD